MREEQIVRLISELIASRQGASVQGLVLGPGDDCAVWQSDQPLAATSDMLVEGVHFSSRYMSYYQIGARAMAANLSDLAAMGAEPAYALLALGLAEEPTEAMIRELLGGMLDQANAYGLALVGGDTVRAPALTVSLSLMGRLPQAPLRRDQARPGQEVWVTGGLGLSGAGLFALQNDSGREAAWRELVRAHISPVPRVAAGRILARHGLRGAVMDISDGLASDLARMGLASQVGAIVERDSIILHPAMLELAARHKRQALDWALYGGEDFELLFTCPAGESGALAADLRASGLRPARIGRITDKSGVYLRGGGQETREISFKGYEHFTADEL